MFEFTGVFVWVKVREVVLVKVGETVLVGVGVKVGVVDIPKKPAMAYISAPCQLTATSLDE